MEQILNYLFTDTQLALHLKAIFLGCFRLFVFLSFCPIFGDQLTYPAKLPIMVALYIPLHPLMLAQAEVFYLDKYSDIVFLIAILIKETAIGLIFSFITGLTFYIALSAGTVIDNQRGASMAQGSEPLSGAETSPLGNALFLMFIVLFFVSGSFMTLMNLFYDSYTLLPVLKFLPSLGSSNISVFTLSNLCYFMEQMLLVCAPFVLVSLMCDVALGLINRFAPQLNVFILSMPIKSGVCALLIVFYISHLMDHFYMLIGNLYSHIRGLFIVFGA